MISNAKESPLPGIHFFRVPCCCGIGECTDSTRMVPKKYTPNTTFQCVSFLNVAALMFCSSDTWRNGCFDVGGVMEFASFQSGWCIWQPAKEPRFKRTCVWGCGMATGNISRWWFEIFCIFTPIWGRFPIWLIFLRWVETTNQILWLNYYESF